MDLEQVAQARVPGEREETMFGSARGDVRTTTLRKVSSVLLRRRKNPI